MRGSFCSEQKQLNLDKTHFRNHKIQPTSLTVFCCFAARKLWGELCELWQLWAWRNKIIKLPEWMIELENSKHGRTKKSQENSDPSHQQWRIPLISVQFPKRNKLDQLATKQSLLVKSVLKKSLPLPHPYTPPEN